MNAMQSVVGPTMVKALVDLVLHSSSRWLGIRTSSSIRVKLKFIGTEVVPHKQMRPCLNYRIQPMDTHRPTLLLFIVTVYTHMPMRLCQRPAPPCTPCLSQIRPHSGPAAVALKIKSWIIMVQDLLPTHRQRPRKCKPIRQSRTPP